MNCSTPSRTDAVVLLDKGEGVTSFACLNYVKRNVNRKTGHCGTLDRFATGLLIACCGKYTKKVPLFMGMDKTYVAQIEFGKETDTLDPEGEVIATSDVPKLETVIQAVEKLKGQIMQVPPVFSALHVNGKRSYELVRQGKEVTLEARPVTIYDARIISFEKNLLDIELKVSKGTYIRSYARDLGLLCGSRAYVTKLRRTQIGPFSVDMAVAYNDENALRSLTPESSDRILEMLNDKA